MTLTARESLSFAARHATAFIAGAVVALAITTAILRPTSQPQLELVVRPAPVVHKLDRRLTDGASYFRCTNQRHDYAENMAYQWKDVTCPECLELRARGPDVPAIEAQANGGAR
jgi:hypothetical protein